jgi:hypothetical protein
MVINKLHIPWAVVTLLLTVLMALIYLANFHPATVPWLSLPTWFGPRPPLRNTVGGTPLGLIYGSLAFLVFVFAAAINLRKKFRNLPLGSVELWLRAHIWFTVLTIPLVLFHCGFKLGGLHTSLIFWLYVVVMVSGFFGLAMQQLMPGLMKERLTREFVFEQIPSMKKRNLQGVEDLLRRLKEEEDHDSSEAASGSSSNFSGSANVAVEQEIGARTMLVEFLRKEVLPFLRKAKISGHRLAKVQNSNNRFRLVKANLPQALHKDLDRVQQAVDDRRFMELQTNCQLWLHSWLLIHAPISFLLIIFTAWHAIVAVRLFIIQ